MGKQTNFGSVVASREEEKGNEMGRSQGEFQLCVSCFIREEDNM